VPVCQLPVTNGCPGFLATRTNGNVGIALKWIQYGTARTTFLYTVVQDTGL
jgi:hypothetical protein